MTRVRIIVLLSVTLGVGWFLGSSATNTIAAYREQQARVDYLWAAFGPAIMQRIQQERAKQEGQKPQAQVPQSSEPPKEEKK